jgi:hypothetical protein
MPSQLVSGHNADSQTLRLGNWPTINRAGLTAGIARTEVGSHGLIFAPVKGDKPHVSVIATTFMDRRRLQPGWKALYQADFFLEEPGKVTPTVALLAITPREDTKFSYNFYRFGVLEGGDRLFFSFSNATPEPVLFHSQPLSDFNLQRPGWHRFQIIFDGPDKIICAIDTIQTNFSPIVESTLTMMHPGLMVTSQKSDLPMFVDNLSIQWTNEPNAALPESPWQASLAERPRVAAGSRTTTTPGTGSTAPAGTAAQAAAPIYGEGSRLNWHTDPQAAWRAAQASGRPLLVMFYAPRIGPSLYLNTITPAGAETEALFNRFELLKIDANQLAGGKIAGDYRVHRLPTFVAIGQNSQEKGRALVVNNVTTWVDLSSQLGALANP